MKKVIFVFITVITILSLCGCYGEKSDKIVGIQQINGVDCYFIAIPYGNDVSDYCTLIGPANTVVVDYFGEWESGTTQTYTVKYQKIQQGGWVAYCDQKMLIMPESFTDNQAELAAGRLAINISDYMSPSEASEYLSWIKTY